MIVKNVRHCHSFYVYLYLSVCQCLYPTSTANTIFPH